ncbi:SixA phosphatase family protein [Sulfurospirillum deleyianum]|uniref:Phosphoglycerate mutase n=1 Tax=Sulfurospirillum deleyianum (strain ATCC 51133 / DSM 6946 / 5175) TaxID=525898 RepID=D1B2H1_SULD5|nr:histidine phosphatase family protein [Sulfurospirillum deleyianum]ACZ12291.1 Phosphoglycerate mutase [Sulfurospirillum deleyianum DSM 6946]
MKKIYFIRHAKSSWSDETLDDFLRPLNARGKADLRLMGRRLKSFDVLPNTIYSSPAKRALKTAKALAEIIGYDKKDIQLHEALYEGSYETYLDVIHQIEDTCDSVFIVGHNPTITEVAERLSGAILSNIPTCAIVCIAFEAEHFQEIGEESGHILFFDYPKKHRKD